LRIDHRLVLSLLAVSALSCSNGGGDPQTVATVTVSPPSASVDVGGMQPFTAVARDADGDVLSGRTFTWTSTSTARATVNANGLATGVSAGVTTIRAATGGVTGSAQLTVNAPGPASITMSTDSADVAVGQTVQLAATVRDGDGNIISASLSWSSASPSTATVDGSGLVMGVSEGTTQITASAGGVSAMTKIVVTPPGNVTVSSITPSPMVEGQAATIRGEGFSPSAAQNNVTINGFAAPVTSASDTLLAIVVPEECFPAGNVTVAVSTPTGSSGAVQHPMQPARPPLSMGVGEFMLIQDPADFCLQFGAQILNEEYVFGVQSMLENHLAVTGVRVRGQIPAGMAGVRATALATPPSALARSGAAATAPTDGRAMQQANAEAELRRKEARLLSERLPTPRAFADSRAFRRSSVPNTLSVGDTVQMHVPDVSANDFCAEFATVSAEVTVVGTRGIWLQDIANGASDLGTAQVQMLSDAFDSRIHDINTAWFGDITDVDNNGRVAILISREVNAIGGFSGFVVSTDFFPALGATCDSSNDGEVYYSIAPDGSTSAAQLLAFSPQLIAHEVTHVIQFGRRFVIQGQAPMSAWEAESQATFAEEINGFADAGRAAGQNHGPVVAWNSDGSSLGTRWHAFGFSRSGSYQGWDGNGGSNTSIPGAPEECTFVYGATATAGAGPCIDGVFARYMMWLFFRWLSDNVASSEAEAQALQRGLIDNDLAGFANIEDVVGEPMETLLAQWAAMLYADDRAVTLDPRVDMPTWNLPAIFSAVDPSMILEPRSFGFAAFSSDVTVRGGSSAYYVVSGLNRPHTAVRARSQSSALLPASAQMWIVRLQ
jgi:hypothetical protein